MAAPPLELNDWVQVNLVGRMHGQTTMYTHLYRFEERSAPGAEFDLQDVVDHFLNIWWANPGGVYRKVHVATFDCVAVTAQILHPVRSVSWLAVPAVLDKGGEVTEAPLPAGASVVIRRRGAIGDRHNYGRVYLSGVPQTWVSNSEVLPAERDQYDSLLSLFEADITVPGLGGNATLKHYVLNRSVINNSRRVNQAILDPIIRYQRRREVGVGV